MGLPLLSPLFLIPQACNILTTLIEDVMTDLCVEVYKKVKVEPAAFIPIKVPEGSNVDIYGQTPDGNTNQFDCPHCKRPIGGAKFAPHLEKCMGLARNSRASKKSQDANGEKNDIMELLGDFDDDDDDVGDTTYSGNVTDKKSRPTFPYSPLEQFSGLPPSLFVSAVGKKPGPKVILRLFNH